MAPRVWTDGSGTALSAANLNAMEADIAAARTNGAADAKTYTDSTDASNRSAWAAADALLVNTTVLTASTDLDSLLGNKTSFAVAPVDWVAQHYPVNNQGFVRTNFWSATSAQMTFDTYQTGVQRRYARIRNSSGWLAWALSNENRLDAVEAKNTAQDTAITGARTGAVADAKAYADGAFVPAWKPLTAYAAGQWVLAPTGDIVSAKAAFTSGAAYFAADWNTSAMAMLIPTKVPAPYVWGVGDTAGYLAIAAEDDGSIRVPKLNPASRIQVSAMGDSLTNGYSSGAAWALTDAWPAKLQGALSGITVTNLGRSGATSSEVNFSVGAKQMWFTGTVAASGSSTVATLQGQAGFQRQFDVVGTLGGVQGTMRRLIDGTFSFTRSTSGTAVALTAPTKFLPTNGNRFGDIVIIGIGRNDVTYLGATMGDDVIRHVVASVQTLVESLIHQSKRIVITGTITATNEPSGSVNYNRITAINNWLKQLYPAYWLDIRRYLIDKAMTDLGLTATTDDQAKIASDTLPPSIMDDSIHYSRATANILALNQYKPFLTEKGWI